MCIRDRLLGRQRRSHTGNHIGIAILVRGDHIHIAFDDDDLLTLADDPMRQVKTIDNVAFVKERCFRCVQILRRAVIEYAPPKPCLLYTSRCV